MNTATRLNEPLLNQHLDHVNRLNKASVKKYFHAFEDIAWDDPDYQVDPTDRRLLNTREGFLGKTSWYQSLSEARQIELNLQLIVDSMATGIIFENVLSRGILFFLSSIPIESDEYRYGLHEVIEESHHSLMFREFICRSGVVSSGLNWWIRAGSKFISLLGSEFPELFFVFTLGGEAPIDYLQRSRLENEADIPLLIERIMHIHVTEEARHISFAKSLLEARVPELSHFKRALLAISAPFIFGLLTKVMMVPSAKTINKFSIPPSALEQAFAKNLEYKRTVKAAFAEVTTLCEELSLIGNTTRPIWKYYGLL